MKCLYNRMYIYIYTYIDIVIGVIGSVTSITIAVTMASSLQPSSCPALLLLCARGEVGDGYVLKWEVSQNPKPQNGGSPNFGSFCWDPYNKDYSILGSPYNYLNEDVPQWCGLRP